MDTNCSIYQTESNGRHTFRIIPAQLKWSTTKNRLVIQQQADLWFTIRVVVKNKNKNPLRHSSFNPYHYKKIFPH
jgi:hypothetical protein